MNEPVTNPTEPKLFEFKTVDQIIADPYFCDFVQKSIYEIKHKRNTQPPPKPGFYYKRDGIDRMSESGLFNDDFFIKNIRDIWFKKSNLCSDYRRIIELVCNEAVHKTIIKRTHESAEQQS